MSKFETLIQRLNRKKRKGKKCKFTGFLADASSNMLFVAKKGKL